MPYRRYDYCVTCKHNQIPSDKAKWGFGIKKEGGCLFPIHGDITSVRCTGYQEKNKK